MREADELGPLNPSATAQLGTRVLSAEIRGRIGPWGRARCSPVPLYAAPCKVGSVTPRYFLRFRDTSNLRVGGSRRRFASLRIVAEQSSATRESLPARH
jgi:hypothetical protein